jgi:hypothetical protein
LPRLTVLLAATEHGRQDGASDDDADGRGNECVNRLDDTGKEPAAAGGVRMLGNVHVARF